MIAASPFPALIAARYRTIRLIATGGMGAVYEVEHTSTGERLALKVLLSNAHASPEALARFQQEARASARIKSDNVVRVTDADVAPELGGVPFLVMELLEGTDLERAAATTPPDPATVIDWLRPVARAIDKAHHLGLVHRDLKPENLFLATRSDGPAQVKILDFGIVKMLEEGTGATDTGQILGTPRYMAPEQASANSRVTPATDRCALGLVAYRLVMGESYYQGGVMVVLGQLLHGQLQAPSTRGSRFGGAFDAWFLKACHRDPDARFASASEQIEALAVALGPGEVSTEAARGVSSRVARRPGAHRSLRVPIAIVLVAAAAGTAILSKRHRVTAKQNEPVASGLPSQEALPAPWACLGHVKGYSPGPIPPKIVVKTKAICWGCGTGGGHAPLPGTRVRVCSVADPRCALPLAHGTTDDSGEVTLNIDTSLYPPPLSVFLEYKRDGYLDLLVQASSTSPLSADIDLNNIPLDDQTSQIAPTALRFGTTYDPTRAYLDVRPLDCNGQVATKQATVTWLDRDDRTVAVPYFVYSRGATAVNLPINAASVTRVVARVTETNQLIGLATAVIRPRAVTYLELAPTP
jgi:serine/threonine-protein kinase